MSFKRSLRIVVPFEVSNYQNWQIELLSYSYRACRQPGLLTALASVKYGTPLPKFDPCVELVPTRWMSKHPITGDHYPPYNKPASFCDYFSSTEPKDEMLLLLDPDMVFTQAWEVPWEPLGEETTYMDPNGKHGKRIIPRHCQKNADMVQPVGFPVLVHNSDLRLIVDRWHILTEGMRQNPQTVRDAPWICEMWAFSIAAAEAGIRFKMVRKCAFSNDELKPDYSLIHYTYSTRSPSGFVWDKRRYQPWDAQPELKDDVSSAGKFLYKLIDDYRSFRYESAFGYRR